MAILKSTSDGLRELALFAGAGGGILGGKLLGWRTVCAVERDAYAASVLAQRQDDGILEPFPIWSDVCSFDGNPWRGIVDVVSGGFPCTDLSVAGNQAGLDGAESGLWFEMARIIGEVRPAFAFVENSPALAYLGGVRVIADLTAMGFECRWGVMGADDAGAPHQRKRIWILAQLPYAMQRPARLGRWEQQPKDREGAENLADADQEREPQPKRGEPDIREWPSDGDWWGAEPGMGRVAHGVAHRVDRIGCLGNGQVPAVVRLAWETLTPSATS